MREVTPTRGAALELADERRLMAQGYELLDETRMLLASEMLRQLGRYESDLAALTAALRGAAGALAAAVERHGFDAFAVYPASPPPPAPAISRSVFLGVGLRHAEPGAPVSGVAEAALDPSPEAEACRAAFDALLRSAIESGVRAGNLRRLAREYGRIERRANALENVLMPEVDDAIKRVGEALETADREDIVRARRWSQPPGGRA